MESIIKKISNFESTNKIEMIVDSREQKIIDILKDHNFSSFTSTNIHSGDIQFLINNTIIFIIERKTIDDLVFSIKDGRFREQKIRLNKYDNRIILYLIEGLIEYRKFQNISKTKICGLPLSTIIGAQTNILVRDKMNIYRTNYIEESVYFILNLYHKFQLYGLEESFLNKCEYVDIIQSKKKDNINPLNCFIIQLSQIPGCSINMAKQIAEESNSMYHLCLAYYCLDTDKEKEKLLENIKYNTSNNKSRKIGSKMSSKIYNYLCITDK